MKSGFWRSALFRVLAVALAICSISDGRTSRIAYAQGATDPGCHQSARGDQSRPVRRGRGAAEAACGEDARRRSGAGAGLFYEMMGRRDEAQPMLERISNIRSAPNLAPPNTRGSAVPPARFGSSSSPTTPTALPRSGRRRIRPFIPAGASCSSGPQQRRGGQARSRMRCRPTTNGFRRCSGWRRR